MLKFTSMTRIILDTIELVYFAVHFCLVPFKGGRVKNNIVRFKQIF